MNCERCDSSLSVYVETNTEFDHIHISCPYCGFMKSFVEYRNDDTGEVDYSGIEH